MATNGPASHTPIVLIGATVTGNRGAESMLRAAVQRLSEVIPGATCTLLSLYPRQDMAENRDPALRIVPCSPKTLVFLLFPLALALSLLRRLRLPHRFLLGLPALRAMHDARLVVDLSGISFVDGRGLGILLYNSLVCWIPKLLRVPLVKYAQAMGPFERPLNRWAARRFLPGVARIAARGRKTLEHLEGLNLDPARVRLCADAAFAMRVGEQAREEVAPLLAHAVFARPVVAVAPSSVVAKYCQTHAIDYPTLMAEFVDRLIEQGHGVLLLAHAARPNSDKQKNNDLPVCRTVHARLARSEHCLFHDGALSAEALRLLIGKSRFLVASRFHAMISGLATTTPTMLVGWSHKYAEVLDVFGLEAFCLDYSAFNAQALHDLFARLTQEEAQVRQRIQQALPAVLESSLDNTRLAAEALQEHAESGR